jgi:hypothetical protein
LQIEGRLNISSGEGKRAALSLFFIYTRFRLPTPFGRGRELASKPTLHIGDLLLAAPKHGVMPAMEWPLRPIGLANQKMESLSE